MFSGNYLSLSRSTEPKFLYAPPIHIHFRKVLSSNLFSLMVDSTALYFVAKVRITTESDDMMVQTKSFLREERSFLYEFE